MSVVRIAVSTAVLLALVACAGYPDLEVEYLLSAIGASECAFVRDGTRYDADAMEAQLRLESRRGNGSAATAERFIAGLAGAPATGAQPDLVECPGRDAVPLGEWLTRKLDEYRDNDAPLPDVPDATEMTLSSSTH